MRPYSGRDQDRQPVLLSLRLPGGAAAGGAAHQPSVGGQGFDGSRALLYLYRPSRLRQDLEDAEAVRLLEESGYPCHSAGQCVACLIRRLRESEEFPHEIGLFLSYPPEDVRGFIENKACRFKCAGLWKVYGDEERAKELFRQYKRCTDRCCALWRAGSGLAQLAV